MDGLLTAEKATTIRRSLAIPFDAAPLSRVRLSTFLWITIATCRQSYTTRGVGVVWTTHRLSSLRLRKPKILKLRSGRIGIVHLDEELFVLFGHRLGAGAVG